MNSRWFLALSLVGTLAVACGEDDPVSPNNASTNNTSTNNTSTNNTATNNTATNNTSTNNTSTNNETNNTTNNETNNTTNNETNNGTNNGVVITSCAAIQADECLYTFDCGETTDVCETQYNPNQEVRCCVPGTRGTKTLGEECAAADECASGACINVNNAPKTICLEPCSTSEPACPENYSCNEPLGLCRPSEV